MTVELGRVKLALLSPGQLVRVQHPPFNVLVTRVDDTVHAIEDACPHSGLSLCRGKLEQHVVTCAGHNWQIDVRTGCVVSPSYATDSNPCYRVTIDGDEAVVWSE